MASKKDFTGAATKAKKTTHTEIEKATQQLPDELQQVVESGHEAQQEQEQPIIQQVKQEQQAQEVVEEKPVDAAQIVPPSNAVKEEPAQPVTLERVHRTQQRTPEQIQAARDQMATQGRKGCKAVRINMAFTPNVHEFIKFASRIKGMSVTEFTNYVFDLYMKEHAAEYKQLKELADSTASKW